MENQRKKSVETQRKKSAEKKEKNILGKLVSKGKTTLAVAGVAGAMACEKKVSEAKKPKSKEEIPTWQGEIPDKISFY